MEVVDNVWKQVVVFMQKSCFEWSVLLSSKELVW